MPRVNVAVGVVRDSVGRVLVARRKDDVHQGGLWEFPGGKLEQAEDAKQALGRELYEELNISTISSSPLINITYNYSDLEVRLHVREVSEFSGEPVGQEGQLLKWVALDELNNYPFPAANKPIITAILLGREYAIIGGSNAREILLQLDNVAAQGVKLVQIRVKNLDEQSAEQLMDGLRSKCDELNINYLLNSQMPVRRGVDEGVHLTSSDLTGLSKRPEASGFVAASCHNLQELRKAEELSLDFAVLSPVKETSSHPGADSLGWQQFAEWVEQVNIPVFALGGVAPQDFEQAISCGAQGISGISLYKL
ncbi:8-oxo-dGTP diphosphatase [Bathymodiolus platifrons methanotrophic gill symbiont]|uniref:Nudix family hydrolase n=1 Tax=Bathymodiolus platifrons methanotrophic gill symbiont TaxID=113268 RepID=UPI000B41F000